MRRVVISTIGTSLLTNQINRRESTEDNWYKLIRDTANTTLEQTPLEVQKIIDTLKERAMQKLQQSSVAQIRATSAELNVIYGLYQEQLVQGKQDIHWLIATDTAQGRETAKIVEEFLKLKGLNAQTYAPKGLSTASTLNFSDGMDQLLTQLGQITQGYDKVCFNLVGGFKSLQAYLNTIGMFYADEIIYIFEGENSELIKIPRLPIKIDESAIAPYTVQLALMAAGAEVKYSELIGIPEALVFAVDDEFTLSNWGKLVWNQAKTPLLSGDLLNFPRLEYEQSFKSDYKSTKETDKRVKLQETLAKVSHLLIKHNGGTATLKGDGGVQYEVYTNKDKIAHFRVSEELRVSCITESGILKLRHYGAHDYVNDHP